MKFLFDTNAVIVALDGRDADFRARMAEADEDDIVISSIVLAEVAYGTAQGKPPLSEVLAIFLKHVPVLPFDEGAARAYARLPFRRGGYDRLIAAHAVALGLTLITRDVGDFADVPGLSVEDWTV